MGQAPAFLVDDLQDGSLFGLELKNGTCKSTTVIGEKKYVIVGADDATLSIEVQIVDPNLGEWSVLDCRVHPTVLGTKPLSCKGHSAVLFEDRILVLKKGSKSDDQIWFLEAMVARGDLGAELPIEEVPM